VDEGQRSQRFPGAGNRRVQRIPRQLYGPLRGHLDSRRRRPWPASSPLPGQACAGLPPAPTGSRAATHAL
jgi:hypothetical protein